MVRSFTRSKIDLCGIDKCGKTVQRQGSPCAYASAFQHWEVALPLQAVSWLVQPCMTWNAGQGGRGAHQGAPQSSAAWLWHCSECGRVNNGTATNARRGVAEKLEGQVLDASSCVSSHCPGDSSLCAQELQFQEDNGGQFESFDATLCTMQERGTP